MSVKVIFTRRNSLVSKVVRWFTRSEWSHVGVIEGNYVIEAVEGKGVVRTRIDEVKKGSDRVAIVTFDGYSHTQVLKKMKTQLNKPYDWRAVLAFFFRRDWSSQDRWFCSELVAWALGEVGRPLFRESASRVTPRDLWIVSANADVEIVEVSK